MEASSKGTLVSVSKEISNSYTRRDGSDASFEYKEVTINTSTDPERPFYLTAQIKPDFYSLLIGVNPGDVVDFKVRVGNYRLFVSKKSGEEVAFTNVDLLFIKKND